MGWYLPLFFAGQVGNDPTLLGLTDRRCTILASDPYIFADSIGFEPMLELSLRWINSPLGQLPVF